MSIERQLKQEFDYLIQDFHRNREAARSLETPNQEDDEFVRAAIVGFARHCDPDAWDRGHFEFIRRKREGDFSHESLTGLYGTQSADFAVLACLYLGALLGMYQAETVTEQEFLTAEALLPGFLAQNAGRIATIG